MFYRNKYIHGKNNYTTLNSLNMPKLILYILISFMLFFSACEKSTIISEQTRAGKIYGYSVLAPSYDANFGIINYVNGDFANHATIPFISKFANQGMITPNKVYSVPLPWILNNGISTGNVGQVKRVNTVTNVMDSFSTGSIYPIACLTYSPTTQKTYALDANTVFEYTVSESSSPKTMIRGTHFLDNTSNIDFYSASSTAHGYLPYLYLASRSGLKKLDLNNGIYSQLTSPADSNSDYFGIRYNQHDSMVYVLHSIQDSLSGEYTSELLQINPMNDVIQTYISTSQSKLTYINSSQYTATIHCCDNVYVFHQKFQFYNFNLKDKTVQTYTSTKDFQGLVWTNE